jgi:hypothetical protein
MVADSNPLALRTFVERYLDHMKGSDDTHDSCCNSKLLARTCQ